VTEWLGLDASEVPFTPAGSIAATDVQAALVEVDGDVTAHVADTVDAHDASAISFTPAGSIAATDVQAAIAELDITVATAADATSITPACDTADIVKQTNSQAAGTLTINAPTGTPNDGQELMLRIKSTNVQTFSWNATYRGSLDTPLPVSTYAGSTTCYLGFRYNATDLRWDLVAVADGY